MIERLVRAAASEHGFDLAVLRGGWFYSADSWHTRALAEGLLAGRLRRGCSSSASRYSAAATLALGGVVMSYLGVAFLAVQLLSFRREPLPTLAAVVAGSGVLARELDHTR